MASPMAMVGLGATALGGVTSAFGSLTQAKGQQLGIQGSMLNTIGQIFGLEQQANQYTYAANIADYQAAVARVNQSIAKANASYARDAGEVSAEQEGLKERAAISQMKAGQAASGIDVNSVSSTRVRESMIEIGQYNQDMIRNNAARVAYGFDVQAVQADAQAKLYDYTSTMDKNQAADTIKAAGLAEEALPLEQQAMSLAGTAGGIGAFGSLLGATASVASKWTEGSQKGLFS